MRMIAMISGLVALTTAGAADAAPGYFFNDAVTADVTITAPAGVAYPAGPLGLVGGLQSGPITFLAPVAAPVQITVTAAGFGDVFELVLDGASLGITSGVPFGGNEVSTGTFVPVLAAGPHSVDIWDFIMSYAGADSPFGGAVPALNSDNPLLVSDLSVQIVPEPFGSVVMALGTLGWAVHRRRAG